MGAPLRLLVGLVLVVTLAGCGSLSDTGPATASVTPVAVPEAVTVPGITESGMDADRLARAHERTLARTNYTVRVTEVVTGDGHRLRSAMRSREIARENQAYGIVRRVNATGIPVSAAAPYEAYWYNQSGTLLRFGTGPRTEYLVYDSGSSGPLPDPSGRENVRTILAAFTFRVSNVSTDATARDNRTRYVLRSQRVTDLESIPTTSYIGAPANATATVWVRDDGVVREIRLDYDATAGGFDGRVQVHLRFRYQRVGNTSVQPPEWAAQALEHGR